MKQRIALAIAVIVGAISLAFVPSAASARSAFHLYETNNNTVYVTTDGTVPYGAAETGSSPGRDLYLGSTGQNYSDPSGYCPRGGCPVYLFILGSGYCLAPDNSFTFLEIRDCTNAGAYWAVAIPQSGNGYEFINRAASNAASSTQFMAGDGSKGFQLELCGFTIGISCFSNLYTKWDTHDIII
jgi:hypothetical protein